MARQSSAAGPVKSHYGWRWFLVLFAGLSGLSIGCTPQSLSMFLMPFSDSKGLDPKYKIFTSDKEVTLAVLSHFKVSQIQDDIRTADKELADQVSLFLRQRCEVNKHKLKLIPQAQVRSYQLNHLASDDFDPVEMGKHFKADYVLQLEIESLGIYVPKSYPKMFSGSTQVNVRLHKIKSKEDDGYVVFEEPYNAEFPKEPIQADRGNPAQFRRLFLDKCGREISRMFIAYPPEEMREHKD